MTYAMALLLIALVSVPAFAAEAPDVQSGPAASQTASEPPPQNQQMPVPAPAPVEPPKVPQAGYTLGVEDVIEITVLQPEKLTANVTVAPDGTVTFPYVGNVAVRGQTLGEVQQTITKGLADGYMMYPVVSVSLQASRSRKFFVYGEVIKPGTYPLEQNMSVLRAISMAGGFTKFGSSSRVKVLRPFKDKAGYETLKVNMKEIMEGSSSEDVLLQSDDIVVVSEGVF